MNSQTRIKRSDRLLTSSITDELVMFDTENGKYYGLNDIATEIWNTLEKPLTVEELCSRLTDEFEVSREQCLEDLLAFLPELLKKGLLKTA